MLRPNLRLWFQPLVQLRHVVQRTNKDDHHPFELVSRALSLAFGNYDAAFAAEARRELESRFLSERIVLWLAGSDSERGFRDKNASPENAATELPALKAVADALLVRMSVKYCVV